MQQKIVLIGNSPLVFFLARQLDKSLANLVQYQVIWLTTEDSMPGLGHFGGESVKFKDKIQHARLIKAEVKSISLREKHIVTTRGLIDYNMLLIDQAPYYRQEEVKRINKSVDDLVMMVKARLNQGKNDFAKIITKGSSVEALQLACSVSDRVRRHGGPSSSRVVINCDASIKVRPKLQKFLAQTFGDAKKLPGAVATLSIEPPRPMVDLKTVKGLRLDKKGQAMLEAGGFVLGYPEVIILNEADRAWQNLLRAERSLAGDLTGNVEHFLAGLKSELSDGENGEAFKLTKDDGVYVKLGNMASVRFRARIVNQLEKSLLKNLAKESRD